jgi:hypothetical protein
MNNPRCTLTAVCSPDFQYIYVMGGFNGQPLNVVERYSVMDGQWEFMAPMKQQRFMHASCISVSETSMSVGGFGTMMNSME